MQEDRLLADLLSSLSRRLDEILADTGTREFCRGCIPNPIQTPCVDCRCRKDGYQTIRIGWNIWKRYGSAYRFYSSVCGGMNS